MCIQIIPVFLCGHRGICTWQLCDRAQRRGPPIPCPFTQPDRDYISAPCDACGDPEWRGPDMEEGGVRLPEWMVQRGRAQQRRH